MEWKEIEGSWNAPAGSTTVKSTTGGGTKKVKGEAVDLTPGTTYCIRCVSTNGSARGEPGKELIIDTEQVGCTPKAEKSCCVIQ